MAWILGVIYTDGNLSKPYRNAKYLRVTIGQKDVELLEKVRALMESNALLRHDPARGTAGALYSIGIDNVEISQDLQQLGLTENKSLTTSFPLMPSDMVRHFIRGCWDGDGSVYWEGNDNRKPCASYVSGSNDFIEQLTRHLVDLGLPDRAIHVSTRSKNPSYYFRYSGPPCVTLYHLLYDGVDERMYLKRKHDRFKAIADLLDLDSTAAHRFDTKRPQEIREANALLMNDLKSHTHSKPPQDGAGEEEN